MNTDWNEQIHRYITGQTTDEEARHLEARLKADDKLADLYLRHIELEVGLEAQAASAQVTRELLTSPTEAAPRKSPNRLSWRPLTAAAAGLVFGMFCTSVVFGFVALRPSFQTLPLPVFDPGFEGVKPLDKGIPHRPEEWGVRSAKITKADRSVQPHEGSSMLRMEPVHDHEDDDNFSAEAFQVLDLSQIPRGNTPDRIEVAVTAAFAAASDDKARYLMRVVALDEAPESATRDFWTKADKAEVVSMTQRFDAAPSASGWHSHSVKIPVPSTARSLVIVIAVLVPKNTSTPSAPHFLDDVQVSLIQHQGDPVLP